MLFEDIKKLSGKCICGKTHNLSVSNVILCSGAINNLSNFINELLPIGEVLIVCDTNTYKAAGEMVEEQLIVNNLKYRTLILNSEKLYANEVAVKSVINALDDAKCIIAIGSGTINDISRYVSFKINVPFISVPTAPSMDGYVSTVAAMTFSGCKVTEIALSPIAVIADTDILCKAPRNLILAGVGDILGKFTCLADWEIASVITEEIYCEKIATLTREAINKVVESLMSIKNGEKQGIEALMYALLLCNAECLS